MDYSVLLNNGQTINLTGVTDFNPENFTEILNTREIQFVNIGGAIVNKHIILSITPINKNN